MQKVISDGVKFFIKSYDEAGNAQSISKAFDSELEAKEAMDSGDFENVQVEKPEEIVPEAPVEATEPAQAPVVESEEDKKKEEVGSPSENPSETSTETPSVESTPESGENKPEETITE